jgi:hypothetical protein
MTTATKSPPSQRLAKLERKRDELHRAALEARAELNAYDAETERLRAGYTARVATHPAEFENSANKAPLPGTGAEQLRAVIAQRMAGANPHEPAYLAARDRFHAADREVEEFKLAALGERVDEYVDDARQAESDIRAAFEQLLRGCERYRVAREEVLGVLVATEGYSGRDLEADERVDDWAQLAAEALADDGLVLPGVHIREEEE